MVDFIIHPGETINDILNDRGMGKKELARRTGADPKYISEIVDGKANISTTFAKSLEYALGVSSSFWLNLQSNYEQEICEKSHDLRRF